MVSSGVLILHVVEQVSMVVCHPVMPHWLCFKEQTKNQNTALFFLKAKLNHKSL